MPSRTGGEGPSRGTAARLGHGTGTALRRGVDAIVWTGAALVGGGFFVVARAETLGAVTVLLAMAWVRGMRALTLCAAFAVALGAWRACRTVEAHERMRDDSARVVRAPARCDGTGTVRSSPTWQRGSLRFDVEFDRLACADATADWRGLVALYGGPLSVARGDRIEVVAQLGAPQRLWNEATGDPRPAEARRGIVRSGSALDVIVLKRAGGPAALVDRARARVRARIEATFPTASAAMARALVLGEADLAPEDDEAFRASGLAHLLAVSGMHLVLVVGSAVTLMRAGLVRVTALAARGDVGRIAAALAVPMAWVYADFAGSGGSARRAAWMLTTVYVARTLGRRADAPRALGISLGAMSVGDPLIGFDPSFSLSVAATAGLLWGAGPLAAWLSQRLPASLDSVVKATSTTLAATVACAPILARFAPTLPLGGVLANLLAVPLGELAALPLCLAHALLFGWPAAERGCALAASGALLAVRALAQLASAVRWLALEVPPPTSMQYAVLAVAVFGASMWERPRRASRIAMAAAALCLAELRARSAGAPTGLLRTTFLDVGQGDAALVDLPDGGALLIDAGGLVGSTLDTGLRVIAPALRARRRSRLLAAIVSHPHPDHFLGMRTGLAGVRPHAFWNAGPAPDDTPAAGYDELVAQMRARGVPVVSPDALCGRRTLDGATIEVLAPCPSPLPDRGANDNSLVLRVAYKERALLFVGDAERAEERDLLRLGPERLRADVLKVGHHGSLTSSAPAFVAAVRPAHAIISVGVRNRFGHPHPTTLATLSAARARIWRTDRDGAITAVTDGHRLEVSSLSVVDDGWHLPHFAFP